MREQISIYYLISVILIFFGVLFTFRVYTITTAQINLLNLGAALITLSTAIVGVLHYKKINNLFMNLSKFNFFLGLVLIFVGFGFQGFNESSKLVKFFHNLDSNPLVLICLGVTIGSIATISNFNKSKSDEENEKLMNKLKNLEKEKDLLEKEIIKASAFIESLKERK